MTPVIIHHKTQCANIMDIFWPRQCDTTDLNCSWYQFTQPEDPVLPYMSADKLYCFRLLCKRRRPVIYII